MDTNELAPARATDRTLTALPTATSPELEIANAIVRVNKELFGRGPTKARVIIHGNLVVCVLADCLTRAERTLVQHGRHEVVAAARYEMHRVARPELIRAVERLTGERVATCVTGIDVEAGEQTATFRLDAPDVRHADDSGAVR